MPMIGSNVTLRARQKPTRLDWLQPVDSPVFTDWMLDSATHPIRIRMRQMMAPEPVSWAAVFASGGRPDPYTFNEESTLIFSISTGTGENHTSSSNYTYYVCLIVFEILYLNSLHSPGGGIFLTYGYNGKESIDFTCWKDVNSRHPKDDVHVRGVDARGVTCDLLSEDPGWHPDTSPEPETPQAVSFFGAVKNEAPEGEYWFSTRYARLYECEILESSTDSTVLARFVPALSKGVPGLLEEISGKFYPCAGKVSGYYSLKGEEVSFGDPE